MKADETPFVDLLFNLLLGYAFLFLISFLLIQPIVKAKELSTQAEFVITVTWPEGNRDDVDTWVEDPLGNKVWYRQKERGLMHLDRDDLGYKNDVVYAPDGTKLEFPFNQEILTVRGFIGGEWCLNLHMYKKRDENPTPVHVTFEKLNPYFQTVLSKEFVLSENFEEVTVARFTMTPAGEIMAIDNLPKKLIEVGNV